MHVVKFFDIQSKKTHSDITEKQAFHWPLSQDGALHSLMSIPEHGDTFPDGALLRRPVLRFLYGHATPRGTQ